LSDIEHNSQSVASLPVLSGCKANDVDIVYTMWANLKKTPDMDVGQVGFYKQKEVSHVTTVAAALHKCNFYEIIMVDAFNSK